MSSGLIPLHLSCDKQNTDINQNLAFKLIAPIYNWEKEAADLPLRKLHIKHVTGETKCTCLQSKKGKCSVSRRWMHNMARPQPGKVPHTKLWIISTCQGHQMLKQTKTMGGRTGGIKWTVCVWKKSDTFQKKT